MAASSHGPGLSVCFAIKPSRKRSTKRWRSRHRTMLDDLAHSVNLSDQVRLFKP